MRGYGSGRESGRISERGAEIESGGKGIRKITSKGIRRGAGRGLGRRVGRGPRRGSRIRSGRGSRIISSMVIERGSG